jgi:hypothetical protein
MINYEKFLAPPGRGVLSHVVRELLAQGIDCKEIKDREFYQVLA